MIKYVGIIEGIIVGVNIRSNFWECGYSPFCMVTYFPYGGGSAFAFEFGCLWINL